MAAAQVYNAFTKSYKLRYVVHAYRHADAKRTLCGRDIAKGSKVKFDADADRACKKCVKVLEIEARIHPGFAG